MDSHKEIMSKKNKIIKDPFFFTNNCKRKGAKKRPGSLFINKVINILIKIYFRLT